MLIYFFLLAALVAIANLLKTSCARSPFGIICFEGIFIITFIAYIFIPLSIAIIFDPIYPRFVYIKFLIFCLLCLAFFLLPRYMSKNQFKMNENVLNSFELIHASSHPQAIDLRTIWQIYIPILLISTLAFIQIDPSDYGKVSGGLFAVILFVARLLRPLLLISSFFWFHQNSKIHKFLAISIIFIHLPFIFESGRRSDAFFILISLLSTFFIAKYKTLSFRYSFLALIGGLFIFLVFPLLRSSSSEFLLSKFGASSWLEGLLAALTIQSGDMEASYAANVFQVLQESALYDYFAPFLNAFVNQFASSTLFGDDFKNYLTSPVYAFDERCRLSSYCGTFFIQDKWWYSPTGFVAAYEGFGLGSFLYFYLAGFFMFRFQLKKLNRYLSSHASPDGLIYCCVLSYLPLIIYDSVPAYILSTSVSLVIIKAASARKIILESIATKNKLNFIAPSTTEK